MPLETLLLFVPACFALNMAFGPNNLLSMTIGARHGLRAALVAAAGRLVAFIMMISVAALGMGALLMASEIAFTVVKLLGAAYLVWLGIKILRSKSELPSENQELVKNGVCGFIRQEFLVAIGNPKAILIFTAFFPQFVAPANYWGSFMILGAVFLTLELLAIALYAYAGTRLSGVMRNAHGLRWINRISGSTMIAFGALLAVARRPTA
ncbi:LysE family transporter [Pseudooceanicola sp. GBMRC 2024]|uniref:LysE family transporter n=1 Tax=Pseudooceanicola albus TaxID=2692189 RepID=A0A6L7GAK2_9RHOB|nr:MULTISPECIES: LysE family translocator [Pseudooceanicola]MXN21234.1 LysE family transporter [Pseudooceanicola albus]